MKQTTILERIVEERVGQTFVGNISVATDRLADEIAREALADENFRRSFREMVRTCSREMLKRLVERRPSRPVRARTRRRAKR